MSARYPHLPAEEQQRGDNLTARIAEIKAEPANPSNGSLPLYRAAARNAYSNAARHTEQPKGRP